MSDRENQHQRLAQDHRAQQQALIAARERITQLEAENAELRLENLRLRGRPLSFAA